MDRNLLRRVPARVCAAFAEPVAEPPGGAEVSTRGRVAGRFVNEGLRVSVGQVS